MVIIVIIKRGVWVGGWVAATMYITSERGTGNEVGAHTSCESNSLIYIPPPLTATDRSHYSPCSGQTSTPSPVKPYPLNHLRRTTPSSAPTLRSGVNDVLWRARIPTLRLRAIINDLKMSLCVCVWQVRRSSVEARQAETDQKVSGVDAAAADRTGGAGTAADRHHRRTTVAQR